LKQSAKPAPQERKRRKIELKGTFEQFLQIQEEQKREETEEEAAAANQVANNVHAANINPTGPNIIGNVEDMQSMQLAQEEETPQLGGADVVMDHTFE
jgi:hypothetical protein